jgi:hypothetical protein
VDGFTAQRKAAGPKIVKPQFPEAPKGGAEPQPAAAPQLLSVPPQEVAAATPRFDSVATSLIDPTQPTAQQLLAERAAKEAVSASAEEAATTAEPGHEAPIAQEDVVMPEPDLQIAALGSGVKAVPPPLPTTETPVETVAAPAVSGAPVQTPVALPQHQTPEPIPPAATNSNPPDWGDEKKLIETLRADWKSAPVARSFGVGEQVPSEIRLKPLPPSVASRDQGVNMHYFIANEAAVLVLPRLRVVVDVYHNPEASLAGR